MSDPWLKCIINEQNKIHKLTLFFDFVSVQDAHARHLLSINLLEISAAQNESSDHEAKLSANMLLGSANQSCFNEWMR